MRNITLYNIYQENKKKYTWVLYQGWPAYDTVFCPLKTQWFFTFLNNFKLLRHYFITIEENYIDGLYIRSYFTLAKCNRITENTSDIIVRSVPTQQAKQFFFFNTQKPGKHDNTAAATKFKK